MLSNPKTLTYGKKNVQLANFPFLYTTSMFSLTDSKNLLDHCYIYLAFQILHIYIKAKIHSVKKKKSLTHETRYRW